MDIASEVFGKKRVVIGRLADAGFTLHQGDTTQESVYTYTEQFMDGDLTAVIKISLDGSGDTSLDAARSGKTSCAADAAQSITVTNSVVDSESGDEYLPMNIEAHTGSYVGQAREEYKVLLERVASKCFSDVPFISDQANRIASRISAEFGVEPEFPFTVKEKDKEARQDKDTAVFRHKDTGKWFAIIMTIACRKLEGYLDIHSTTSRILKDGRTDSGTDAGSYINAADPDERINVMNVKIYPEELDDLLKEPGLYRCYHMNKKQWVSIALDDETADERIVELLKISFNLTRGGSLLRRRGSTKLVRETTVYYEENGDKRYWLIPSNPATFDVAKGFRDSGNDTLEWHHRINVMPGDIVYIYQTEPVASIMWECEVLESYKPRPAGWGSFAPNAKYSMTLKRLRSFKKGDYPRSWMNEHGVAKTVRGQRSAPAELVQALK